MKKHTYIGLVKQVWEMRDDGDTFRCLLDLGHRTLVDAKIRLKGIDTDELLDKDPSRRVKAYAARDYLRMRLATALDLGKEAWVETLEFERSFDRYVSDLYIDGVDIDQEMIELGLSRAAD